MLQFDRVGRRRDELTVEGKEQPGQQRVQVAHAAQGHAHALFRTRFRRPLPAVQVQQEIATLVLNIGRIVDGALRGYRTPSGSGRRLLVAHGE